jgi:hypothetical protein
VIFHLANMSAIHVIKKSEAGLPPILPVAGEANTFTSGFWTLSEDSARSLVGGQIYFHERQRGPSFYGGRIIDTWRESHGEYAGKIVFKFVFSQDSRGVKTSADNWSQEMKFVP